MIALFSPQLPVLLAALAAGPTAPAAPAAAAAPLPMPPPPPPSREAWPLAEVSVGGSVLSRAATLCAAPLEAWCGRDANLVYSTSLPYLGGAARAMVFPFSRGEAVEWRGLGFEGRYGWAATYVGDSSAPLVLAIDQAWSVEVLYRQQVEVMGWRPWIGARLGAGSHRFDVPGTVEGLQLQRGVGPTMGVDAGVTLFGSALRLELGLRYAMGENPGPAERALYGDGASTDGYFASVGLAGAFGEGGGDGLGWSASLEQQLFLDTFRGTGTRAPEGAWLMEQYTALTAGLRYRF